MILTIILLIACFVGYSVISIFPSKKPSPVAPNLIMLERTADNEGRRCEAREIDGDWNDRDLYCRNLQADFIGAISPKNNIDGFESQSPGGGKEEINARKVEKARELIKLGANVNEMRSEKIPIEVAAEYGNRETVILLLENGADVCHKDTVELGASFSALDFAKKANNSVGIRLLYDYGAGICVNRLSPL